MFTANTFHEEIIDPNGLEKLFNLDPKLCTPNNNPTINSSLEDRIVTHVIKHYPTNQTIKLLSLSSSYLLQDLAILIRLIKAGFHSFEVTLIKPSKYSAYLSTYLDEITKRFNLSLTSKVTSLIPNIDESNNSYDIIYGIDYPHYYNKADFSRQARIEDRGLYLDALESIENQAACRRFYSPIIELLKAFNRSCDATSCSTPLVIISHQQDIFCLTDHRLSTITQYPLLADILPKQANIDTIYIHTNILHLIQNVHFFKTFNRPILINDSIIKMEDKSAVESFLKKHNLTGTFINENKMKMSGQMQTNPDGITLIVDYTLCNTSIIDQPIPTFFNKKNTCIIRSVIEENKAESAHIYPALDAISANRIPLSVDASLNEKCEKIDKKILGSIPSSFFSMTSQRKASYLVQLNNHIKKMNVNDREQFALYLLNTKEHLLKSERYGFFTPFSNETKSMHLAIKKLIEDKFQPNDSSVVINHHLLSRHLKSS